MQKTINFGVISQYTKLANIPEILLFYRINENQVSNKYNKEQKETAQRIREEYINDFLAERNVPINFSSQSTINEILQLRHYIREKYILKKILLTWCDSSENKKEIVRLLTSTNIFNIGLVNSLRIVFHKVIKNDKNI